MLDQRAAVLDVSAEVSVGVVDVAHNRTHYPLMLVHEPYRIAIVGESHRSSKRAVLYCCLAKEAGAPDIVCGARAASCLILSHVVASKLGGLWERFSFLPQLSHILAR